MKYNIHTLLLSWTSFNTNDKVKYRSCKYSAESSYHFTPAGGRHVWLQSEQRSYLDFGVELEGKSPLSRR